MDLRNYGTTLSKPINPPFSYAGSKRKHANKIKEFFPKDLARYERFVEPFCGTGAMTLNIQPSNALLNDINPDIKNVFDAIRNNADTFNRDISKFKKDEHSYYAIRNWDRKSFFERTSNYARALRFIYVSKLCFGGSAEYNRKCQITRAYDKLDGYHINCCIPNIEEINEFLNKNNIQISCIDYHDLELNQNDFVFIDPPYDTFSFKKKNLRRYWGNNWTKDCTKEVLSWLEELDNRGITFCMSNFGTELVQEFAQRHNFDVVEISVKHDINYAVQQESRVTEVLVRNYGE